MFPLVKQIVLTCGKGTGSTTLNAFDAALLDGGIGNFNLLKISSIVPPGVEVVLAENDIEYLRVLDKKGSFVPVVYCFNTSKKVGQSIASAVSVGIPKDKTLNGVIFEATVLGSKTKAGNLASLMVKEAMSNRGQSEYEIRTISNEVTVPNLNGYACTICAAVFII